MGQKIMLTNVRCAFLVLGEPEQYQGKGPFRWSATALVPAGSDLKKAVDAALEATAKEKWDKKIRPLAVVGDKPLEIEGYGTVPPLSQFIPGFKDPINYFGIFVPKGVPADVTATLDKIWATQIANSEALKKYAQGRGALFAPLYGEAAQQAVFPAIQAYAWTQQAAGKAKVSPDTVGIAKP